MSAEGVWLRARNETSCLGAIAIQYLEYLRNSKNFPLHENSPHIYTISFYLTQAGSYKFAASCFVWDQAEKIPILLLGKKEDKVNVMRITG